MSNTMNYQNGAWHTERRGKTDTAYCDEASVKAFMSKVKQGIYPSPCRQKGMLPKWHRHKLDYAIARRHGLFMPDACMPTEDAAELI